MQRYYKNCTYANKANIIFKKDRFIYQNHHILRFCGSSSVGGYISLPCGQKSKLSKPRVSVVVEIVEISASVAISAFLCQSVLVRGTLIPTNYTDLHRYSVYPCKSVLVRGWYHLPLTKHLSVVLVLTTEPHGTSLNQGVCFKQLQQDLVYNNINNFVQQQFRGGTTHPHGRDCFYC